MKEGLEAAAENDLISREIEEENRLIRELGPDHGATLKHLKKMHFTIYKNNEMPQEFFHYDRVRVPNKIRPSHID